MTEEACHEAANQALQIIVRGVASMTNETWDAPLSEARKRIYVKVALALFFKVTDNNLLAAQRFFDRCMEDLAPGSMRPLN
jgi:hypothetical protein